MRVTVANQELSIQFVGALSLLGVDTRIQMVELKIKNWKSKKFYDFFDFSWSLLVKNEIFLNRFQFEIDKIDMLYNQLLLILDEFE